MKNKHQFSMSEDDPLLIKERKRWMFFGLPFTFTKYRLSAKNLNLRKGFFTTTEDDLLLFRVMDISIKRTLMQKIMRLGTMIIISSDKTDSTLEVKNIKRIHNFKSVLEKCVEEERQRMRFRTGEIAETGLEHDDSSEFSK